MRKKGFILCIVLLALALTAAFPALAQEAEIQPRATVDIGLYRYDISLGKANLVEYYGSETNITVPDSVVYDGVTNKVVQIGSYLYEGQTQLETVVIPASIKTLGVSAFDDCINLKSVTFCGDIADPAPAFGNTGSLSGGYTVTFQSGVTEIPETLFRTTNPKEDEIYAFVKKVVMADTVKSIGYRAFENCFSLTDIVWSSGLETIGESAFDECTGLTELKLPASLKTVKSGAFEACSGVKTLELPASLKTLKYDAFQNCISLTDVTVKGSISDCGPAFDNTGTLSGGYTVTFADGVTLVPGYMFESSGEKEDEYYAKVKKVILADTVTEIGFHAFYKCFDLSGVEWSSGLETIGEYAFSYTALKKAELPEKVKTLKSGAFEYCTSLETVVLPASLKKTGTNVFYGCTALKDLTVEGDIAEYVDSFGNTGSLPGGYTATFEEGVTAVPSEFFWSAGTELNENYAILTKVNLPDSLKKIGMSSFKNCHSLTEISIPRYVTEIESYAFENCTHLETVYYAGSPNEWAAIKIGSCNEPLLNADLICALEDTVEPTAITLNKEKATLKIGKKLTLKATLEPENAVATVTWSTSDKKVATVTGEGVVKATGAGTAVITAETVNGLKATCKITVKAAEPTKISLNKKKATLYVGKKLTLKVTLKPAGSESALTWKSSNKKVATVSKKGVVKAVGKGKATITVKTANGLKATCRITVKAPQPTKVVLNKKGTVTLKLGKTLKLKATLKPAGAESALTWKSSNEKVAVVSSKGVVVPVKKGTTVITVKTSNGKTAKVKVKVK